jgi:antitoxin HicB
MGYPFVVEQADDGYAASAAQFPSLAASKDRSELDRLMAEQLALVLQDYRERGERPPEPIAKEDVDTSDYEGGVYEIVFIEPVGLNPISLSIEKAIDEVGISRAELARRMKAPASVVSRLVNPFYWGHSARSLREVAAALNADLEVRFVQAKPPQKRRSSTSASF